MQERTFSLSTAHRDVPSLGRIGQFRAAAALIWAAGFVAALGGDLPAEAAVPALVAVLLVVYPLIDVLSSAVEARGSGARLPIANALISLAAAAALGVAATAHAAATLAVFGIWAVVSGAVLLGAALARRRAGSHELPMIVSGGLSMLAGLSFVAGSTQDTAHLTMLAGYAAAGAVLYLVWAARSGR